MKIMSIATRMAAFAISASLVAAASAASASVWVATYTGDVFRSDPDGVFGAETGDIETFVAKFTYDTAIGTGGYALNEIDEVYAYLQGGSYFGVASPMSATLTINGKTVDYAGSERAYATSVPYPVYDGTTNHFIVDSFNRGMLAASNTPLYSANLEASVPLTSGNAAYYGYGYFYFDRAVGGWETWSFELSPAQVVGVPEPATWAMMIVGFGATGSMIRRRKALIA